MNLILRQARIVHPNSEFHNQIVDIRITDGKIASIGENLPANQDREFSFDGLHVSEGWFDSSVSFGEPGFEERESVRNGVDVAAKSGFTSVAVQPNCQPVTDSQSQVNFLKGKSHGSAVDIYPIGALTKGSQGKDLAELFDMQNAGAIAFGDYNKSADNANMLKIALQYAQDFDGMVIAYSSDGSIAGHGVVNEGIVSTRLGLKGIPALAEELAVARNLFILEYTGGKMHIPCISTSKSVALIRAAKTKGLQVTCSASVHHLTLTDEKLETFDTRFKVSPPLRDEETRQMLLQGVIDGTIDMITSDHNPIDMENKKLEFDLAKNGTIGLESAFGALNGVLPLDIVIEKLTAARRIFGIEKYAFSKGSSANFTLFTPHGEWEFSPKDILSKSKNSAFLGHRMKGRAIGIVNRGKLLTKE